jgi:hypothetical protein
MTRENRCRETTFGYLSALESPEHGFFGGYLLISLRGRPLEFHCTAPVRPNRAQQILYGPLLHPYLLGEQIGGALVREAAIVPQLILTDQVAVLSLRSQIEMPIVYIRDVGDLAGLANRLGQDDAVGESASSGERLELNNALGRFQLHGHACQLAPGYESDSELVLKPLAELVQYVELVEPFDRIHEAIREAQRIGGEGLEVHGQAA